MSISDLFDSGFRKRNEDHFAAIVRVAMDDGIISDEEQARLMKKEGISAFQHEQVEDADDDDITKGDLLGESGGDSASEHYQFDPREAYMMKLLLERPYQ